jgi:hypothetical protein
MASLRMKGGKQNRRRKIKCKRSQTAGGGAKPILSPIP